MLHPSDIANKTFDKGMGGYKQDAVDSFLEMVAQEYSNLLTQKEEAESKLEVLAEKIQEYRNDEDSLRAALIGAQKLGDSVIRESNEKADRILREAGKKAEFLITDAKSAISREQNALMQMKKEVAKFKNELFETYKIHIELISRISDYDINDENNKKAINNKETKQETLETQDQPEDENQEEVSFDDIDPQTSDAEITGEINEIVFDEQPEENSEEEAVSVTSQAKYEELKFGDNYDAFSSRKPSSKSSFLKRKK